MWQEEGKARAKALEWERSREKTDVAGVSAEHDGAGGVCQGLREESLVGA